MTAHNLILLAGTGTRWLQLFVSLSLLIILHEFGHFFFAKRFKMRVEKFYLFFDFLFPFSGLFNFSLFKKKSGDTEYGIGWFPLGGYVKIAGMVDESMDKEELAQPPKPWEYRSKPAWQRLFTMLGGIIVNIIVAMVIYMVVFGVWGEQYLPAQNAQYGIMTDSLAQRMGFRNGDRLVGTDGRKAVRFDDVFHSVLNGAKSVQITRDGRPMDIPVHADAVSEIIQKKQRLFDARVPAVVEDVADKGEAKRMGLAKGDSIIAINDQPVAYFDEVQTKLATLRGQPVHMRVFNSRGELKSLDGTVDTNGRLGFQRYDYTHFLKLETIHYTPLQAISKGFTYTFTKFADYAASFKLLFHKGVKLKDNLGGIGTFSKIFPTEFDMQSFLMLTAFISIVLAFMNLLPIPGLDGGYVIFLLYELVTRRKVSDKVMEYATTVGLVLLLALMLYANGLDIFRAIKS